MPRPTPLAPSGALSRVVRPASLPAAAVLAMAALVAGCGSSNSSPARSNPGGTSRSAASLTAGGSPGAAGSAATTSATASEARAGSSSQAPAAANSPATGSARGFQDQMVAVIKRVNPSVVLIETSEGLGSGVVFDDRGDIVTNAHVVGSSKTFKVTASDGRTMNGSLVGSFVPDDLAVVRVAGARLAAATFGDSSKLAVGDVVLAMGNPLGLQSSVTEGIVSALGRTVSEPGGAALPNVIQTSAAINPGNSGGALVDLEGQVVGIPTLAASDPQMGGAAAGIGFAISSNMARDVATQLVQTGRVTNSHRAYLGIAAADTNGQGVLVYSVTSGGPAAKAGINAGDVIVAIDGQATPDSGTLATIMAGRSPGQTVRVDLIRQDGSRASVTVSLAQIPG